MNTNARVLDLVEKMSALLDNVRVERRVFQQLAQIVREDSTTLQGVANELAQLQSLLEEGIRELST